MCFPVNFAKFLKTPFLTEHLQWLLLLIESSWSLQYSNTLMGLSQNRKCHSNALIFANGLNFVLLLCQTKITLIIDQTGNKIPNYLKWNRLSVL